MQVNVFCIASYAGFDSPPAREGSCKLLIYCDHMESELNHSWESDGMIAILCSYITIDQLLLFSHALYGPCN